MADTGSLLERDVYNVTRLNREVRAVLEGSFPPLWVQGEISNLARPASGHIYFSLKDRHSQVRCAMFKNRMRNLKFQPDNGMEILARANVGLYEGRGEFQLIIEQMEPAGEGALQQAFEKLKQKLNNEGLFEDKHKKPLPAFPASIGIITSASGAAVKDILQVLSRRYPLASVIIYPVAVQGEKSAGEIVSAIGKANQRRECDVLILSRGGGSLEDLWSFNEEIVARAVFDSELPIVSGVGHEIDFTIADFVADKRAPTPSAAAELVSPDSAELLRKLETRENALAGYLGNMLKFYSAHLKQLEIRLPHPQKQLQQIAQRIDELALRSQNSMRNRLAGKQNAVLKQNAALNRFSPRQMLKLHRERCQSLLEQMQLHLNHKLESTSQRLKHLAHGLHTVSPLATLERGYSIVRIDDNEIVRDVSQLRPGQSTTTRVASGEFISTVKEVKPPE